MKKWEILNESLPESISESIQIILQNRGLVTPEAIESFLHPKLEELTVGNVGIDQAELLSAIKRITAAIEHKEKIIVYGDYDVDGITGAAIMWESLHNLGAEAMPYLPHRVDEGYGLSRKGITNLLKTHPDTKVIITVDNGIVATDAVAYANELGIDVIITDHHVAAGDDSSSKPEAYAIVHTTKLCGAGVAYLMSKELKKALMPEIDEGIAKEGTRENKPHSFAEDDHLELAALGTIADLVPLTGANRTIVLYGLKKLQQTKRKGLLALFLDAGIDPATIGVYHVGHQIGPRLNATGRMESAMDSLRLVCTKDAFRAKELASLLGKVNRERQEVMAQATEHASLSVKKREILKKLLVVHDASYPEGVIGLVAGRLVEEYYRPAIVIAKGEKTSKGSVRSVNGFNIIEFLRQSSEYFVNVGGHPMAAGFTIETDKVEALQEVLENMAHDLVGDEMLIRTLKADMVLPLAMITSDFYLELKKLGPFGMANPDPTFISKRVEVKDKRQLGKEGKHLRLLLQQDYGPIVESIAFGMGEWYEKITKGDLIDIAYTIDENTWQGNTKLQLKVKDLKKT